MNNSAFENEATQRADLATKITWIGLVINSILTLFKFFAGIFGNSAAMIADAVHSLSDFATDVVVIFSFKIVKKPIDDNHDYGHGKFETLAGFLVGLALLIVAAGIFYSGIKNVIFSLNGGKLETPGILALIAALFSIGIKEWLYRYQVKIGEKIKSSAVIANAWHHRSDAFSSIGTFLGIGGAVILGKKFAILDPLAAVIVSFFIFKVAYDITIFNIQELLEVSLPNSEKELIINHVKSVDGAFNPHRLRTRRIGGYWAIDMHIEVERHLTVVEAHQIADTVENKIRKEFGESTSVIVHVDPMGNFD